MTGSQPQMAGKRRKTKELRALLVLSRKPTRLQLFLLPLHASPPLVRHTGDLVLSIQCPRLCFSRSCQRVFLWTWPAGTCYRGGSRKLNTTSCLSLRGANMLTRGRFFTYERLENWSSFLFHLFPSCFFYALPLVLFSPSLRCLYCHLLSADATS